MEDNPFLDRLSDIDITEHNLPHWHQEGKIQYVTFHACDSLPLKEQLKLKELKDNFEKTHPKPWDKEILKKYHSIISDRKDKMLDKGYGSCLLRKPELRVIVENSIKFYHNKKYFIISCVIMPNHVHLLALMLKDNDMNKVLSSILRFTATKINKQCNLRGAFWNREGFDRIVRSEVHLKHCRAYIKNNSKFLKESEFTYWEN